MSLYERNFNAWSSEFIVFITRDKKTTKRLINFQFNHFAKFLLQIVYSDYKLMSQPTENDRYFVSSSTSPCSIREMSIIFPCHWRAKNVQPRIFHRGHSMLEASVVLEEISTMGRVSHLSLSLSLPLLHLWINNPNPSQQSLLSMAAKMLENAPSSAFWVRISIRRPLEGRGSGPEQRQLSLSLFVFVVPAVRRISMWVNSVLDYARARMHDFQNEVSGGAHRTRRDTVSVLLQTKSKSLREGGGNCPRTIRGRWKFGIWDENRIRKKRIGWE